MAQSSSYKQYARATRVLTEESGFAGGMLWTSNNIDNTHLKTIVNCDYDDTTGFLKTRDPLVTTSVAFDELLINDNEEHASINLTDYKLLNAYNICPTDITYNGDETLLDAGWLYVFVKDTFIDKNSIWSVTFGDDNVICVYKDASGFYLCKNNFEYQVILSSINLQSTLLNSENTLYGVSAYKVHSGKVCPCIQSYRLEYKVDSAKYTCLTSVTEPDDWRDSKSIGKYGVYKDKVFTPLTTILMYEPGKYYRLSKCFELVQTPKETVWKKIDSVTLAEANVTGFNAARGSNIFTYKSTPSTDDNDPGRIKGWYFTDARGNLLVSPRIDQPVQIHVLVDYPKDLGDDRVKIALFRLNEVNNTSSEKVWEYTGITLEDENDENGVEFTIDYRFNKKSTTLGIAYYGTAEVPTSPEFYSETAKDRFVATVTTSDNLANLKLKPYDLSTSTGRCLWRNRMCLWGLTEYNNCLFLSEIDNFHYYPVPHNVAVFDTNVISCIPYKDTLLVFTADKIYRMSENNDGSFSQAVVQNDMPLTIADAAHLTAVKNMVLFKSGNYFYMIVPKSQSLTDELSVAPIYKNVAGFLNTLDKSVQEVLQLLYPEYRFNTCAILPNNNPVSIYAEQDTLHILYDIHTDVTLKVVEDNKNKINTEQRKFKMFLNYNTNLRAWTLYFEDTTDSTLEAAALTAARRMSFVRINKEGTFSIVTQQVSDSDVTPFRVLIDTGYRTLSASTQKRFREIQLKMHSTTESNTAFGTAFLVDGVWRRNYAKLQEVSLDNNSISLVPELDLNTFVTELTMPVMENGDIAKTPGSDAIELSDWTLDFSHFKREAPITVRIPVSGKGFNPRFIFMAPNAVGITINEINWVYRLMHGR